MVKKKLFRDLDYKETVRLYNKLGKNRSKEYRKGLILGLRVGATYDKKAMKYLENKMKKLM